MGAAVEAQVARFLRGGERDDAPGPGGDDAVPGDVVDAGARRPAPASA